jgi:Tfp pilus assembly protein FimT
MTLLELLVVLTVVSTMSLMAASRFKTLTERSALRSARQQVEAAIATARASAIQKGRTSIFYVAGNYIGVVTQVNDVGGYTQTLQPISLDSALKVKVEVKGGASTLLVFTPRGFASPRLPSMGKFVLSRGSRVDSTCISIIGQVIGQRCVQ